MDINKVPKVPQKYKCNICDYTTSRLSQYNRHIMTSKHKMVLNGINQAPESSKTHICSCGKIYTYYSGLYRHKKTCEDINITNDAITEIEYNEEKTELQNNSNLILDILTPSATTYEVPSLQKQTLSTTSTEFPQKTSADASVFFQNQDFKEMILEKPLNDTNDSLIIELLKQNQEFKELMIEQNKYMMEQSKHMIELASKTGNTNYNNTTNNTKFNMQFFLNETCKNAMSITEFVDSLELTFEDLENVGRVGYAEGISQIFIKGIRATEVCKRPIHCSDIKRVVMFINDINGWEKDSNSNEKIIRLIKQIAKKNMKQASIWISQHQHIVHGHGSREQNNIPR